MDKLNALQKEFEDVERRLRFPLDLQELQLTERRRSVLSQARELAKTADISGSHWFNVAC